MLKSSARLAKELWSGAILLKAIPARVWSTNKENVLRLLLLAENFPAEEPEPANYHASWSETYENRDQQLQLELARYATRMILEGQLRFDGLSETFGETFMAVATDCLSDYLLTQCDTMPQTLEDAVVANLARRAIGGKLGSQRLYRRRNSELRELVLSAIAKQMQSEEIHWLDLTGRRPLKADIVRYFSERLMALEWCDVPQDPNFRTALFDLVADQIVNGARDFEELCSSLPDQSTAQLTERIVIRAMRMHPWRISGRTQSAFPAFLKERIAEAVVQMAASSTTRLSHQFAAVLSRLSILPAIGKKMAKEILSRSFSWKELCRAEMNRSFRRATLHEMRQGSLPLDIALDILEDSDPASLQFVAEHCENCDEFVSAAAQRLSQRIEAAGVHGLVKVVAKARSGYYRLRLLARNAVSDVVRSCAVRTLRELGDEGAVPLLLEILSSERSKAARVEITAALGALGGEKVAHELMALLTRREHPAVRTKARSALRQLGISSPEVVSAEAKKVVEGPVAVTQQGRAEVLNLAAGIASNLFGTSNRATEATLNSVSRDSDCHPIEQMDVEERMIVFAAQGSTLNPSGLSRLIGRAKAAVPEGIGARVNELTNRIRGEEGWLLVVSYFLKKLGLVPDSEEDVELASPWWNPEPVPIL